MLIAALAMAGLLGWSQDDGPAELVARLGAPRFADREAAALSLRRLGDSALPALRRARSASDPEIRIRAAKVREEIEADSLLKPTRVRLDFHDRPLSEVVEAIGRRAGVTLAPTDGSSMRRRRPDRPSWPDRRVTVEAAEPLPFWEAIDRLGRAGGLGRPSHQQSHGPDNPFDRLVLEPGEASPFRTDAGPLRVELVRIRRERSLDLLPGLSSYGRGSIVIGPDVPGSGAPVKDVRGSFFFAELLISAEPRLSIAGEVAVENLKAIDDQGRSLLPEPSAEQRKAGLEVLRMNPDRDPRLHPELRFGSGSWQSSSTRIRRIPLDDSTPPGSRMAKLEGVIAVAVMGRRADPLIVPLADAGEKTVESDGVRVTVHEAAVKPNHFYGELELTLETERPAGTLRVQGPGIGPVEIDRPLDLIEREIEILDDHDQLIAWSFLRPPPGGLRGRMRLQVRPRDQGTRLDFSGLKLRVSTMVGAATEFPFAFADIPMP